VGMDSANVVSSPDDSAIAQGAGGVALNDTEDFAVSTGNYSPAIQGADQVAFVGAGNAAQGVENSAVAQGSQAVNNANNNAIAESGNAVYAPTQTGAMNQGSGQAQSVTGGAVPVAANQGSGLANNGNMGNATITDTPTHTVTASIGTPAAPPTNLMGVQTIALTELKQVNAGLSIGNGNGVFNGATTINANSQNSASNGVLATSASLGIMSNSAAQNVVNVSANITQRQGP
jgi:hypothetical protein